MKVYGYEGGIRYEVGDFPQPTAAFTKFIESLPCSCGGEAHDECREDPYEEEDDLLREDMEMLGFDLDEVNLALDRKQEEL
jgi:hypothetical protein